MLVCERVALDLLSGGRANEVDRSKPTERQEQTGPKERRRYPTEPKGLPRLRKARRPKPKVGQREQRAPMPEIWHAAEGSA